MIICYEIVLAFYIFQIKNIAKLNFVKFIKYFYSFFLKIFLSVLLIIIIKYLLIIVLEKTFLTFSLHNIVLFPHFKFIYLKTLIINLLLINYFFHFKRYLYYC